MEYEYKCVGAPERVGRRRGAKSRSDRVAGAMEELIVAEAIDGWEYMRTDLVPVEERAGLFSRVQEVHRAVLVFRRALDLAELGRASRAVPEPIPVEPPRRRERVADDIDTPRRRSIEDEPAPRRTRIIDDTDMPRRHERIAEDTDTSRRRERFDDFDVPPDPAARPRSRAIPADDPIPLSADDRELTDRLRGDFPDRRPPRGRG